MLLELIKRRKTERALQNEWEEQTKGDLRIKFGGKMEECTGGERQLLRCQRGRDVMGVQESGWMKRNDL